MPLTVRKFNAQVKDPTSGDMIPAGLLSSDSLEAIEAAETAAVAAVGAKQAVSEAAIELKGATTLASIPADYTTLDNEVDDLKTQLDDVKEVTVSEETSTVTEDIYSDLTFTNGYMIEDGTTGDSADYKYTNKIAVKPGDVFFYTTSAYTFRYITAFSGNTAVSASGGRSLNTYTVPDGIDGIIITIYVSRDGTPINYTHDVTTITNILNDDIEDINNEISAIQTAIVTTDYVDTDISPLETAWTAGYMDTNGNAYESTNLSYSGKISVNPGDFFEFANSNYQFRFVTAFNGNSAIAAKGSSTSTNKYVVPDGIDGVILTVYNANKNDASYAKVENKISANVVKTPMGYTTIAGNLNDGDSLSLPTTNVKNKNRYIFNAKITTFDKLKIGKGSAQIEITNTNLIVYNGSTVLETLPHGITIDKFITVLIENEDSTYPSLIRIVSNDGNTYEWNSSTRQFNMSGGTPTVTSDGSVLTDCRFSWTSANINAPIWMFGDSYFSWDWNGTAWTCYLAEDGYTKSVLLNGYAGENSQFSYYSLVNLLKCTTPKIVVWCLGMNDPDNTTQYEAGTAVNASWYNIYNLLVELQKKYNFELVLYTVPSTPKWDNSFKNAIVRASGYRYIDADGFIRVDNSGNWISGALASDDTHPTVEGAKILYSCFLSELPELMSDY